MLPTEFKESTEAVSSNPCPYAVTCPHAGEPTCPGRHGAFETCPEFLVLEDALGALGEVAA